MNIVTDLQSTPDPIGTLELARSELGPIGADDSGFTIVTGHPEALEVLRHPAARTAPIGEAFKAVLPEGAARDEMANRINFLDPPDHPRVRGIISKAFTPRRVEVLRPYVAELCNTRLDALTGGSVGTEIDLVADFAHEIPSLVISELLGVPADERDRLTRLSDAVAPLLSSSVAPDVLEAAVPSAEEMHAYFRTLIDARADDPRDDLLSALIEAEESGERLTRPELLSLVATLYSAGHRTTRDLFCNGMALLLGEPELFASVSADAIAPADVVAEFLRLTTPTLFVVRFVIETCEIGGHVTAPGPIMVALAAANRDPRVYTDPDAFVPSRWAAADPPPAPVSFAFGAHYCLGASLAKLEAETMYAYLVGRFPDIALAGGPADLEWRQRGPFRSLAALPVVLG